MSYPIAHQARPSICSHGGPSLASVSRNNFGRQHMLMLEEATSLKRILRESNDVWRTNPTNVSRVSFSPKLTQQSNFFRDRALDQVRRFSEFSRKDPIDAHTSAAFYLDGHKLVWRIIYLDPTGTHLAQVPIDPVSVSRVLVIGFAHESPLAT
jgi:Protein of unknown function (DUF3768)